ncbi:MAG: methyltransferase domain-containing protein [Nitrospiraceae bacterium]|nr:methyltransferase domain-containing protein [Nitrospiraceae bacterium]
MSVRIGTFDELPKLIQPGHVVLDVGGGIKPLSRANYVLDFLAWDQRTGLTPWFRDVWPEPHFSQATWVKWDICSRDPWPFKDKQFDFVLCKGTLEDLRDPIWVCREMMRVSKAGYFETPTKDYRKHAWHRAHPVLRVFTSSLALRSGRWRDSVYV